MLSQRKVWTSGGSLQTAVAALLQMQEKEGLFTPIGYVSFHFVQFVY